MHTNPICHWAGGPKLLLDLDYRAPRETRTTHPTTQAEVLALGLPAATALWPCQEVAGNLIDPIGAVDLVPTNAPLQGQRASGIYYNGDITGTSKKAIEATYNTTQRFAAAAAGSLDIALQDFAIWLEFRVARTMFAAGDRSVLGKWNGTNGYRFTITLGGLMKWVVSDAVTTITCTATQAAMGSGAWHGILLICDRTAGFLRFVTQAGTTSIALGAVGSLTNAALFSLLYPGAGDSAAPVQISNAIMWIGAGVTGMGTATFNLLNANHGKDPATGIAPHMPLNLCTYNAVLLGTAGPYTAGFGQHNIEWYGTNGAPAGQWPIHWNSKLRGGLGGFGLSSHSQVTGYQPAGVVDDFANAAWTKVTSAISGTAANLNDSPRGMRDAQRMLTSAANGYIRSNQFATTPGNVYTFTIFIKRHSGSAVDVPGTIEFWNVSAGASAATQAFTATTEWQLITLTFTAAVGQILTQIRVNVTPNGGAISLHRYQVFDGGAFTFNTTSATMPRVLNKLSSVAPGNGPGVYQKGSKGEIEIVFATNYAANPGVQRYMLAEYSTGTGVPANVHDETLSGADLDQTTVYNSGGGADHVGNGTNLNLANEHTVKYRWDVAGLPSGNTSEIIEDGGAPISASVAPWVATDTVNDFVVGGDVLTSPPTLQLNGQIARIRIWDGPR